jgi:transposase
MKPQQQYVGLDVSLEQTSVCAVDDAEATIWRGKCKSTPEGIHYVVAKHAPEAVRIGLETGQLATWLFHELKSRQLPVNCIDARHAKAALSLHINKTDANDARGIAQIVRVRLVGAILLEHNDEWAVQRARYMTLETIAPLREDPIFKLPGMAA